MPSIADNVARIQEAITDAAAAAGRSAEEIALVAVTKYAGVTEAAALREAGCDLLAESRPQELWKKAAAPELQGAEWHLVGHLQRNKVDRTLPLVRLIHSVDSQRLLQAVDKAAATQRLQAAVLLEVNCSGESAKHGFSPDELQQLLDEIEPYRHVSIRGLMTMAPREGGMVAARDSFALLRTLRDEVAFAMGKGECTELSMGMSGDFRAAIAEGSTMVRIGSALFDGVAIHRA